MRGQRHLGKNCFRIDCMILLANINSPSMLKNSWQSFLLNSPETYRYRSQIDAFKTEYNIPVAKSSTQPPDLLVRPKNRSRMNLRPPPGCFAFNSVMRSLTVINKSAICLTPLRTKNLRPKLPKSPPNLLPKSSLQSLLNPRSNPLQRQRQSYHLWPPRL